MFCIIENEKQNGMSYLDIQIIIEDKRCRLTQLSTANQLLVNTSRTLKFFLKKCIPLKSYK